MQAAHTRVGAQGLQQRCRGLGVEKHRVTTDLDALRQRPNDFVTFPAPAGPKGRGYMPVVAGLSIAKDAPNRAGAVALIDHLSTARTQLVTAAEVGFFPVVKADLPTDLAPGVRLAANAIALTQNARDALAIAHRGYVLVLGQNRFEDAGPALAANPEVAHMFLGG